jgi:uncharacterized protein
MPTLAVAAYYRPTLLVFTRGPGAEVRRRRLLPGRHSEAERALYEACLGAALSAGREAGCRLVVSSPVDLALPADVERFEQRGRTFGERLAAALESAGPGPVVVVGADVPDLTARPIERALAELAADPNRAVVGPSPDGGFYLLAVARPLAGLLGRVRFGRKDTAASLEQSLAAAGFSVSRLAHRLTDLDHAADLSGWLARPGATDSWLTQLRGALRELLAALARPESEPDRRVPRLVLASSAAPRGPPR